MNEHESERIEGGRNVEEATRQNQAASEARLLIWAVSASAAAALFLGLLLVQQFQQKGVAPAVGHSAPSSVPGAVSDATPAEPSDTTELEPPPVPPLPDIYLSDLKPIRFLSGWGQSGVNKSVIGNPLKVGGKTYKRGLGTHAYGEAVFDIPANARRFVAVVGLEDEVLDDQFGRGSVSFAVFGDAGDPAEGPVLLGHSPVLAPTTARSWAFDLELNSRFKRIELVVSDARDGAECDHADWVNAGFLK